MLAIKGGKPVRNIPYPPHTTTGEEEAQAAADIVRKGILSDFEGSNNRWFLGGDCVKRFEREWAEHFGVKHAISVNSATSGLFAAIGAAGVAPGDEVITTPWTMTATAAAIVAYHAVPIFADIEADTFTLDPKAVEKKITPRTKAIMPVHIYGHPADMDPILALAKKHKLAVIEDASQSPAIKYKGKYTGAIGDMGVFSLNCHKIIQTGEGGFVTTDDDELARRLQLIRNHAEAVIATGFEHSTLVNMVGWNYRLNEMEAAIGSVQLRKLDELLRVRRELAERLTAGIKDLPGLLMPAIKKGCGHSYYRYPLRLDVKKLGFGAQTLVKVLNAEGLDWYPGYTPLNLFPLYQEQIGFGPDGCPFRCAHYKGGKLDYSMKTLPTVERMRHESLSTETITHQRDNAEIDEMIEAFRKVWDDLDVVRELDRPSKPAKAVARR